MNWTSLSIYDLSVRSVMNWLSAIDHYGTNRDGFARTPEALPAFIASPYTLMTGSYAINWIVRRAPRRNPLT